MRLVKVLCAAWLLLIFAAVGMAAGTTQQHKGRLNELQGYLNTGITLEQASAKMISKLPAPVSGEVLIGRLGRYVSRTEMSIAIVISPNGPKYGYADVNGDGRFEPSERFTFAENDEAEMPFPLGSGVFRSAKAKVKYNEYRHEPPVGNLAEAKPSDGNIAKESTPQPATQVHRELYISMPNWATATVEIDGQKILFKYHIDLSRQIIDPANDFLWVDCDGNGQFDHNNVEYVEPKGEPVVFRVGKHYLATTSVDINSGEVVVEEHPASDYIRIELVKGTTVPDFAFKDFDGKRHQLAEYHGKYVLLDFWGTWCGACIRGMPEIKAAYDKYHSRGFEILGMDMEAGLHSSAGTTREEYAKGIEKARELLAKKGITWQQASSESIEELVQKRFCPSSYPTLLLLDPEGKIISMDLYNGQLEKVLENLLGEASHITNDK